MIIGLPTIYFIISTELTEGLFFDLDNGIANVNAYYQRDRFTWCVVIFLTWDKHPQSYFIIPQNNPLYESVGVIFQHKIGTIEVISSYHDIIPLL